MCSTCQAVLKAAEESLENIKCLSEARRGVPVAQVSASLARCILTTDKKVILAEFVMVPKWQWSLNRLSREDTEPALHRQPRQ